MVSPNKAMFGVTLVTLFALAIWTSYSQSEFSLALMIVTLSATVLGTVMTLQYGNRASQSSAIPTTIGAHRTTAIADEATDLPDPTQQGFDIPL
jgi:preprotein translocase subunit SecF